MQGRDWLMASMLCVGLWLIASKAYTQPFARFAEADQMGIRDANGNTVVSAAYDFLGWSHDTTLTIEAERIGYKQNGFWGLLDVKNEERIAPPRYYTLQPLADQTFLASERKNYFRGQVFGTLDAAGEVVIPFRHFSLEPFGSYFIARKWVENQLRYGLLHPKEGTVLPFEYQQIVPLDDTLLSVTNPKGKTALYHIEGRWITTFLFDQLFPFEGKYAKVYANGKMGLINREGEIILSPEYRSIVFVEEDSVSCERYDAWWVFTQNRDTVHRFEADHIGPIAEGSYQLKAGPADILWNDSTGIFHLPGYEASLGPFEGGLATMEVDGLLGAVDIFGRVIVPTQYDTLYRASDYFFAARRFGDSLAWDIWNPVGFQINQEPYEEVMPLQEGYFPVRQFGRWGFMNSSGKVTLACIYDTIPQPFRYQHAIVKFHGLQGIIDTAGSWVRTPEEASLAIISPSLFRRKVGALTEIRRLADQSLFFRSTGRLEPRPDGFLLEEERKVGLKNWAGEWIVSPQYDSLSLPISDKFYAYQDGDEQGILTLDGERAMKGSEGFQSLYPVTEGFFPVKISNRFGFVDDQARLRVANRYDSVAAYSEDRAAIQLRGRWGAIDAHERLVIQPLYDEPFFIDQGRAVVKQRGQYGIIDVNGNTVLPFEYSSITLLPSGRFLAQREERFGLLDPDGYELLPPRYSYLEVIKDEVVIVKKRESYGLLAYDGRDLIPTLFDLITYDAINDVFLAREQRESVNFRLETSPAVPEP
ncbi:MAG: WG repeat-containing protein [Bacteroidota bacterium]